MTQSRAVHVFGGPERERVRKGDVYRIKYVKAAKWKKCLGFISIEGVLTDGVGMTSINVSQRPKSYKHMCWEYFVTHGIGGN